MKQFLFILTFVFFAFFGNEKAFAGAYNPQNATLSTPTSFSKNIKEKVQIGKNAVQKWQEKAKFSPKKEKQRNFNYLGAMVKALLLAIIFGAITFVTSGLLLQIMVICTAISGAVALAFLFLWIYYSL